MYVVQDGTSCEHTIIIIIIVIILHYWPFRLRWAAAKQLKTLELIEQNQNSAHKEKFLLQ